MISPVSSFSASSWVSPMISANEANTNLNIFNPAIRARDQASKEIKGFNVQVHNIPEVLQWLSKKIEKDFNVKIFNSDIPFSEEELKAVYNTLAQIPEQHLKGVLSIVKNRGLQLNLQEAPTSVFAKMHKSKVYGAYDKENKRIYIFELDDNRQLPSVLKHEVGHAVHSYNMKFKDFFLFSLKHGWDVAYHEQHFIGGNEFYNIGTKIVIMEKQKALELADHFDWESLRHNKDKYAKHVMVAPQEHRDKYAFKNPFETFAVIYEKTI